jgi:hypothetical protein
MTKVHFPLKVVKSVKTALANHEQLLAVKPVRYESFEIVGRGVAFPAAPFLIGLRSHLELE